jgi:hypothetical protein
MSIYDSLPEYRDIKISFGRTVRIKKLNLGESLEWGEYYRYYKFLETIQNTPVKGVLQIGNTASEQTRLLREMAGISIMLDDRKADRSRMLFLTKRDLTAIMEQSQDMNRSRLKVGESSSGSASRNDGWLDDLLALFGAHGMEKKEVLSLYPDEILARIRAYKKRDLIRLADHASAQHAPGSIMERLEELDGGDGAAQKDKISSEEAKRMEEKYCQNNYGAR